MFKSSAQAINIETAEVINSVAVVEGGKAAKNAQIRWQGSPVTTSNRNEGFEFGFAEVPASCVGTLSDGTTTMRVKLVNCTPFDVVPKTGQTTSYATGDDGALQKGVAWPIPRFTVNVNTADDTGAGGGIAGNGICDGTETCNGTITDNLTGLIWLKNANCLGTSTPWQGALNFANGLASGACGLTDSSNAGDWRLPNVNELRSLLDYSNSFPALPSNHQFSNISNFYYWSSTTEASVFGATRAWAADFTLGDIQRLSKTSPGNNSLALAVRGGS